MVLLLILRFLLGNLYLPISWTIISAGIYCLSHVTHIPRIVPCQYSLGATVCGT